MKKLIFLFVMAITGTTLLAQDGVPDYIISGDSVTYYKKVRYGITAGFIGIGESVKDRYRNDKVTSYRKDGRVYEMMPVIRNNKNTGRSEFMEFVAYRNGMKVFRQKDYDSSSDELQYVVYKDHNFVVRFEKKNAASLERFFFKPDNSLASK